MRIAELIARIERQGGQFTLEDREALLSWPALTGAKAKLARALDARAREQAYLATAELLEREASRRWERVACRCSARRFAHAPHRVGDIYQALEALRRLK